MIDQDTGIVQTDAPVALIQVVEAMEREPEGAGVAAFVVALTLLDCEEVFPAAS